MRLPRRSPLLWSAVILTFFTMTTVAADSTTAAAETTGLPNLSSAVASESAKATQTTAAATTSGSGTESSSGTNAVITPTGTDLTSSGSVPTITGGSSASNLPSGLPHLSSAYTIIPASVPPTANAPFMQVSSLPEDSVFIIVGSILGFFALSILLWRGLVAWSLHRSVKRAAQQQYMSTDAKANFRAPPAPFYRYTDRPESTISLSGLGARSGKKGARPTTTSVPAAASASNLFFSPTAGAVSNTPGNRGSNYLPAGYYAAGASSPGNGQGTPHAGTPMFPSTISRSDLDVRPTSRGYSTSGGSPFWNGQNSHAASSSTLNLNQPPGDQRAPSVYLEDLMDGAGGAAPHQQPQYDQAYFNQARPF